MGRDGGPELVIRGEHPWLASSRQAMPVLPRRRDQIREPVEELKWGKLDDAADARPRGLPPAPRANPVGRLVSREHVADVGDAAVLTAPDGEPLQQRAVGHSTAAGVPDSENSSARRGLLSEIRTKSVDGKPAVFPGEHVGCRRSVEQVKAQVAAEQPVHRPRLLHVFADRLHGRELVGRLVERKLPFGDFGVPSSSPALYSTGRLPPWPIAAGDSGRPPGGSHERK